MPIYEYRCTSCGRSVEVLHSISGTGPTACEVCGGAMRKALTAPAIHFKGSGWAKKDARTAAARTAASPDASDGAKAGDGAGEGEGAKVAAGAAEKAGSSETASGSGGDAAKTPSPAPAASGSKAGGEGKTATRPTSSAGKGRAGSAADRSA